MEYYQSMENMLNFKDIKDINHGKTIILDVEQNDTIQNIKRISSEQQRLFFVGKKLENSKYNERITARFAVINNGDITCNKCKYNGGITATLNIMNLNIMILQQHLLLLKDRYHI